MAEQNLLLDGGNLPYSLEAEQSVLGAILLEPGCIVNIADTLRPEHFYLPQHTALYTVLYNMFTLNQKIDLITVLDELKKAGAYDEAGGRTYLLNLAEMVPSVANVEHYARIVREKHDVRSLIVAARQIISDATDETADAEKLIDAAEQRIYEIRQGKNFSGLKHISEVILNETFDRVNKLNNPETRQQFLGASSGIAELDRITTGLNRSDLIIVGARPGMGKTSFVLNIARNAAVNQNKTVCIFSLEMSRDQLAQRLLSSEAQVSSNKLRTGQLEVDDWSRLVTAADLLSKCKIYLDETPGITVPEMKAKLRRMKNVDLVIVDYLQLMDSAKRVENRVQAVSEITRSLKMMAKDLMVPVMVCAQLSRGTEARGKSHRPQLADLRESGSIEQDADIVLFLYRETYYQDSEEIEERDDTAAECIVAKNRHGETDTIKLYWQGEFTRFTSRDVVHGD